MFRKQIMKRYVDDSDVFHVIWHNASVFVQLTLRTLLFLLVAYVLFVVCDKYMNRPYIPWLFGFIGLGFFVKYLIDFLNLYLDALILSASGLTMFMREGLFEQKTDFFEWERIETVSHTQNSFVDKVFGKWDLLIKLEHGVEYPFENINAPQKQAERILKYKQQHEAQSPAVEHAIADDKMSIIAEALSEVVKEYMEKKTSQEDEEDEY